MEFWCNIGSTKRLLGKWSSVEVLCHLHIFKFLFSREVAIGSLLCFSHKWKSESLRYFICYPGLYKLVQEGIQPIYQGMREIWSRWPGQYLPGRGRQNARGGASLCGCVLGTEGRDYRYWEAYGTNWTRRREDSAQNQHQESSRSQGKRSLQRGIVIGEWHFGKQHIFFFILQSSLLTFLAWSLPLFCRWLVIALHFTRWESLMEPTKERITRKKRIAS